MLAHVNFQFVIWPKFFFYRVIVLSALRLKPPGSFEKSLQQVEVDKKEKGKLDLLVEATEQSSL
jgi:hypothetical protein